LKAWSAAFEDLAARRILAVFSLAPPLVRLVKVSFATASIKPKIRLSPAKST
jgi:hypothetical protein